MYAVYMYDSVNTALVVRYRGLKFRLKDAQNNVKHEMCCEHLSSHSRDLIQHERRALQHIANGFSNVTWYSKHQRRNVMP